MLSGVGVGLVWLFIFDPGYGVLAWVLRGLGQQSPQWINDPQLSLVMVIIVYVWKNLGYCAVVYLAGLQSLPRDVMEAAALDGANSARRFFNISMPLLSPHHVLPADHHDAEFIAGLRPHPHHDSVGQRHQHADLRGVLAGVRRYNRAGYSAAISVILFAILLIITVLQLRFVERKVHYS